ncbi:conserved hypothetical protein [Syntrophothermus lipocalidus DSM 12680]|uniref:DUF4258 domain-containing protein n=2 Tax=Syntrophothermus TaxID=129001 RepID=D7CP11_SYNLT|nr:conserved hypothetical protein [Syntrophothermus lipocalidus DSM 12680]
MIEQKSRANNFCSLLAETEGRLMDSNLIREKILSGNWAMSKHARVRAGQRKVKDLEVVMAIAHGDIIEDYPQDARGHSCLVLGYIDPGKPVHAICGLDPSGTLIIITVYFPEPSKWIDERTRRKGD